MNKEEWKKECGYSECEQYIITAIHKHLLTDKQKEYLSKNNISVETMLNGKYPYKLHIVINKIFKEWNKKLGWNEFNIGA